MISLLDAVRHAFAPNGPIQQVLGQHRPAQAEFAINLATFVETSDASLYVNEAFAGVGKTDAVLVVLGLDRLLHNRHATIATFRKSLRSDYSVAIENVNVVVQLTLQQLDHADLYRPVSVGEYKSALSYLSPTKMAHFKATMMSGHHRASDSAAKIFVTMYQEFVDAGIDPEFNQLYEFCQLPAYTTELHWAFGVADRDTPLGQQIRGQQAEAKQADILLITHAMLIRNSLAFGKVLTSDDTDRPRDGALIIDEADKLPPVAYDTLSASVSFNDMREIIGDFVAAHGGLLPGIGDVLQSGLDVFSGWLDTAMLRVMVVNIHDDNSVALIQACAQINGALGRLLFAASNDPDPDVLVIDEVRHLRQELSMIVNAANYGRSKMAIRASRDTDGNPDVLVMINYSLGRNLINQLWRGGHPYSSLAMISATLADPLPEQGYNRFLRMVGFDPAIDTVTAPKPVLRHHYGRVDTVVVADRHAPHPTDGNMIDFINPDFANFAVTGLTTLAAQQQTMPSDARALVLFPSYLLLNKVWEALPHLQDRIVRARRDANLQIAISEFAARPHGIWFGVEWEGVNFIDPVTGRTLADLMAIVRLPHPPADEIRVSRLADVFGNTVAAQHRAQWQALRESSNSAYRKLIHGIARGLRNADDVVKMLMILDIRFPVPLHVADTRAIARSAGDAGRIFTRFDACLDTYRVRHWSQLNLDGSITKIL